MGPTIFSSNLLASASSQLVSLIAFAIAFAALLATFGPWEAPFELRTIRAFEQRFGRLAARLVMLLFAILMAVLGAVILLEIRPAYARTVSVQSRIFSHHCAVPRSLRSRCPLSSRLY